MIDFHKQKLKQIKWWAWLATVGPITALGGLFFAAFIGTHTMARMLLSFGATVFFCIAVFWWWWAMYTIARITGVLGEAIEKIVTVDTEVKEIKTEIKKEIKRNSK